MNKKYGSISMPASTGIKLGFKVFWISIWAWFVDEPVTFTMEGD